MDSFSAFAMGQASRGRRGRVFDWVRAAELIKENKPRNAGAGLSGDWEYTGGTIYTADGIPNQEDTYTYLASTWAIPELSLDGDLIDCWRWEDEAPDWDEHTYWPPEALAIIKDNQR